MWSDWCYDDEALKRHAFDHFSSLYTMDAYSPKDFPLKGHFPKLEDDLIGSLNAEISMEEVRQALFSLAPFKAPRVDGFHVKFYQAN